MVIVRNILLGNLVVLEQDKVSLVYLVYLVKLKMCL